MGDNPAMPLARKDISFLLDPWRFLGRGRFWLLLGAVLVLLGLAGPPLIIHGVIAPKAGPGEQGLRLERFSGLERQGPVWSVARARDTARVALDWPQGSLAAFAVWRVKQGGTYRLELTCDDYGSLLVDGRLLVELSGMAASNAGAAQVELSAGEHLLTVYLNNGPGGGWFSLKAAGPGQTLAAPLGGAQLGYPHQGNILMWWGVLRALRLILWPGLAFLGLGLILLLARPLGRLLAPRPVWAGLVLLFFLCLYLASMGGQFYSHDDSIRFRLVKAMVDQGSLVIGSQADGSPYYCKYGLVQPLLDAPLYLLGKALTPWWDGKGDSGEVLVTTLQQIVTAVTMLLLLLLVLELGHAPPVALGLALVAGLATISWPYAKFHFTEPLNGLCLVGAFWCLVRARRLGSLGWLAGAGIFIAVGGINAFLVLVLGGGLCGLYGLWLLWPRPGGLATGWLRAIKGLLALGLPMLLGLGLQLAYNAYRYGSPLLTGYEGDGGYANLIYNGMPGWSQPWWVGIEGLLLSPGKSVFLFSPPLILAAVYWRRFIARRPAEGWLAAGLCLAWLAFYAKWWAWHGDLSWGPRYLVPVTCIALLPLAEALSDLPRRGWSFAGLLGFLVLAGVAVQLLGVLVPFDFYFSHVVNKDFSNQYLYHYVPHFSPILGHWQMLALARRSELYLLGTAAFPWLCLTAFWLACLAVVGVRASVHKRAT